jgi:hypothetical protein
MQQQPERELARHELEQQVAESLINSRGHPEAIEYLNRILALIELDQEKSMTKVAAYSAVRIRKTP